MNLRHALLPGACAALLVLAACNDDDNGVQPTLANIWPHADGSAWTFETVQVQAYDVAAPPAALPSMAALHADLEQDLAGAVDSIDSAAYTFAFDGVVTTESGAVGQRVVESLEPLAGGVKTAVGAPAERRLLRLIARARPDLRERIGAVLGGDLECKDYTRVDAPLLLGGRAYAYEDSGHYAYGDLDLQHSWIYLAGGLRTGTEFSLQLVPALADDIWLYGRVWSVRDRSFGGVRYDNVVECMQVVDLGEQEAVGESGEPLGTYHAYIYGRVWYAPQIGPVAFQQRSVLGMTGIQDAQFLCLESSGALLEAALPSPD